VSPRRGRHVEVFQDTARQWRFRTKAGNGEVTSTSESYTRYEDAVRGAQADQPTLDIFLRNDGGMEAIAHATYSDTEPDRPEGE
jgi:uncharacterized protein YegP (UPF0339 family)